MRANNRGYAGVHEHFIYTAAGEADGARKGWLEILAT